MILMILPVSDEISKSSSIIRHLSKDNKYNTVINVGRRVQTLRTARAPMNELAVIIANQECNKRDIVPRACRNTRVLRGVVVPFNVLTRTRWVSLHIETKVLYTEGKPNKEVSALYISFV